MAYVIAHSFSQFQHERRLPELQARLREAREQAAAITTASEDAAREYLSLRQVGVACSTGSAGWVGKYAAACAGAETIAACLWSAGAGRGGARHYGGYLTASELPALLAAGAHRARGGR